jgi:hypothetical protein
MQLNHNAAMDSLKIQHREAMTSLKQRHAEAIEGKNALLKEYDDNIEGYEKMFTELLNEMRDKHVSRRQMQKLNKKAAETHANYLQHKVMYDALKDEVRDQQSTSIELRQQLEEYEETIEYLYDKIDNMQSDFDSVISYVDLYYENHRYCSTQCSVDHVSCCGCSDVLACRKYSQAGASEVGREVDGSCHRPLAFCFYKSSRRAAAHTRL